MVFILVAAPEGADPALAPFFQGLEIPGGGHSSCCSLADCRPAAVRLGKSEREVFIDRRSFGDGAPDAWVAVPEAAVLYGHSNPTGFAVVCWHQGRILCFVPASGT
jgi:hypothetical protein